MEFPDRKNERNGSGEGPMMAPTKTQLVKCGSLNIIALHKLIEMGTIRRHSQRCVTVGTDFEVSYAQASPSVDMNSSYCLQIKMCNSEFLLQHHICLHTAMFHHE